MTTSGPHSTGRSQTRGRARAAPGAAMWRYWQGRGHIEEGWATVQRVLADTGRRRSDARTRQHPRRSGRDRVVEGRRPNRRSLLRGQWRLPAGLGTRVDSPTRCSTSAIRGSSVRIPARAKRSGRRRSAGSRRLAIRAAGTGRPDRRKCARDARPGGGGRSSSRACSPATSTRRSFYVAMASGTLSWAMIGTGQYEAALRPRLAIVRAGPEARDIGAATIAVRFGGDRAPAARPSSTGRDS